MPPVRSRRPPRKARPAVALLNATVLTVSHDGRHGLLVKPRKRKRGIRSWELPGGKIDQGESLPAGAVREVLEETGVRVKLETMTALYKCAQQDGLMFVFIARCLGGELAPCTREIDSVCWEPLENLTEKVKSPLHRQRVDDCLSFTGSPVYRLIRKHPFKIYETWDLGPSSLADFHFLPLEDGPAAQNVAVESEPGHTDEAAIPIPTNPWERIFPRFGSQGSRMPNGTTGDWKKAGERTP